MSEEPKASELITLKEAAEYSGLSYSHMRHVAKKGRLEAHKMGMQWFTTREAVDRYIASRERRGRYREDVGLDK
jgi:excisionase family DNA binding protein